MSDRDELARVIKSATRRDSYGSYIRPENAADAVLAAGYRKPREAKAEALEEAANAAESMHEPAAPDCKEWADWLRARATAARTQP